MKAFQKMFDLIEILFSRKQMAVFSLIGDALFSLFTFGACVHLSPFGPSLQRWVSIL